MVWNLLSVSHSTGPNGGVVGIDFAMVWNILFRRKSHEIEGVVGIDFAMVWNL